MTTSGIRTNSKNETQAFSRVALLKRWAALLTSILGIFIFLLFLGPMGLETEMLKPMADFIEEHSINANAYYYTEVDEFFEAERHMHERVARTPNRFHLQAELKTQYAKKPCKTNVCGSCVKTQTKCIR